MNIKVSIFTFLLGINIAVNIFAASQPLELECDPRNPFCQTQEFRPKAVKVSVEKKSRPTADSVKSYFGDGYETYFEEGDNGLKHIIFRIHRRLKNLTDYYAIADYRNTKFEVLCSEIQILENVPAGTKILNETFDFQALGYYGLTILHLAILFLPGDLDKKQIQQLIIKGAKIDARCYIINDEYGITLTPLDLAVYRKNRSLAKLLYRINAPYSDSFKAELMEILELKKHKNNTCNIT